MITFGPMLFNRHPERDITLSEAIRREAPPDKEGYIQSLDFVGLAENHSDHRWSSVTLKAELYDASGEFLDQTKVTLGDLAPHGAEHYKVGFMPFRDKRYQSLLKDSKVKVEVVRGERW